MPFLIGSVLLANETFSPLNDFDPDGILETIAESATVREAAEDLGLLSVLSEQQAERMVEFLDAIPPALDAAVLAAARSAFARGVRVQLTWEPAYDFQVHLWEAAEGSAGLVNINVLSPHPVED